MLHQIHPVAADVGDAAGRAGDFRLQPPAVIQIVQKPVLKIAAVHAVDFADLAGGDAGAHFLNHGIHAIVEVHRRDALRVRAMHLQQRLRLLKIQRQRLFGQQMFSRRQNLLVDLGVQIVGCAVMDYFDFRILQQRVDGRVAFGNLIVFRLPARELLVRVGNGPELAFRDAAHGVDVARADVAHAQNAGLQLLHAAHRQCSRRYFMLMAALSLWVKRVRSSSAQR